MRLEVHNRCSDYSSYRAARVKSLFNAESGANFDLTAELPLEDFDWKLGVIVGPSGSGKSSLGRKMFDGRGLWEPEWPGDRPIVDGISPDGDFDAVTASLAAVGLGDVPSWLRPYRVLSNGEQFRASLARVVCEAPAEVVIDEFTSVVDRQIAKFGALAFQKAWRRTSGKAVLLSCHYDILEWLEPDWVFDTAKGTFSRGGLRRPRFDVDVQQTDWSYWPLFEPHHYLKLPRMVGGKCFVGTVDGEPVVHLAMASKNVGNYGAVEARACRLVVMPEWQGAGVGLRFLNHLCQMNLEGEGPLGRKVTTIFHTSHPGLCQALRRDKRWIQVSAKLFGGNRAKSVATLKKAAAKKNEGFGSNAGYGGHFRAVQGFRYMGPAHAAALTSTPQAQ